MFLKQLNKLFSNYNWHRNRLTPQLFVGKPVFTMIIIALCLLTIRQFGWLQPLELAAYDWMTRHQPDIGMDSRLLVVKITEEDIRRQQRWPLTDDVIAQALANLSKHQPQVIGLDIYRDFPQPPGYEKLIEQLQDSKTVLIRKLGTEDNIEVNAPNFMPPERVGFNDLVLDPDGIVRRNLMYLSFDQKVFASFSLLVTLFYLQQYQISTVASSNHPNEFILGHAHFSPLKSNAGGYQNIDAGGYQILVKYRTPQKVSRYISLSQVLDEDFDPSWVRNKIVLIGTAAASVKDDFIIPHSIDNEDFLMPGVFVHANIISHLLTAALDDPAVFPAHEQAYEHLKSWGYQPLFRFWSEITEVGWILLWTLAGALLVWWIQHPFWLGFIVISGIAILFTSSFILFIQGVWIPTTTPLLAFLISGSGVLTSKLVYNALYDNLTSLPNRTLFQTRLRQFQKCHRFFPCLVKKSLRHFNATVILFDLERFKVLNIVLGSKRSDELLRAFARRIQTVMQEGLFPQQPAFILARVGDNEFALLLRTRLDGEEVKTQICQLNYQLHKAFYLQDEEFFLTANIGIALSPIGEERDLLRDAYAAMYRAKTMVKQGPELFETAMASLALAHFQLERDLRHAVAMQKAYYQTQGQQGVEVFKLHYQPLVCLLTGKIAGFEALVRWYHPQRGIVSPGEFIPIAEETGLILTIGEWVLQEACRQVYQWQQDLPDYRDLNISVNLSAKQFGQQELITIVQNILQTTQLRPQRLKLEITETVIMDDLEMTIHALSALKRLNVQIGIDDFGTGYSSLSYLTQFPIDTLKVDKSFVMNMQTTETNTLIVQAIITLAHSLDMDVIAEGMEMPEQVKQLRALECEFGQGFFFSKPLPKQEATDLLMKMPRW